MNDFYLPFQFALTHGWQIGLTIGGCVLTLGLADELGLLRPWPLPVILGGILSLMILEAYPYAWTLGKYIGVVLWVVMAGAAYCMPLLTPNLANQTPKTVWDYFTAPTPVEPQPDEQQPNASDAYR